MATNLMIVCPLIIDVVMNTEQNTIIMMNDKDDTGNGKDKIDDVLQRLACSRNSLQPHDPSVPFGVRRVVVDQ
jgi:hypothetical protein